MQFGWIDDPAISLALALESAKTAVATDDSEAWGYWAIAGCDMYSGHQDRALLQMRRAVELNPHDADVLADMGLFLSYAGQSEEGLAYALKANRINPSHPEYYDEQLGVIYFNAKRYQDAIQVLDGIRSVTTSALAYRAASYAGAGNVDKASSDVRELLAIEPDATIASWTTGSSAPYVDPLDIEHLASNLRLAGLPD
jgi:tetratricopeptide (TPR) repeat protein